MKDRESKNETHVALSIGNKETEWYSFIWALDQSYVRRARAIWEK